jgi:hypothetical protein
VEEQFLAFGADRGQDRPQLLAGVGLGLDVGEPWESDVGGRVALDELVADGVAIGGANGDEVLTNGRDRPFLDQAVEVVLAVEQAELLGWDPVFAQPAVECSERADVGADRVARAAPPSERVEVALEDRVERA